MKPFVDRYTAGSIATTKELKDEHTKLLKDLVEAPKSRPPNVLLRPSAAPLSETVAKQELAEPTDLAEMAHEDESEQPALKKPACARELRRKASEESQASLGEAVVRKRLQLMPRMMFLGE